MHEGLSREMRFEFEVESSSTFVILDSLNSSKTKFSCCSFSCWHDAGGICFSYCFLAVGVSSPSESQNAYAQP